MLDLVGSGEVRPGDLVTRVIRLDDMPAALAAMTTASTPGVTVIRPASGTSGQPSAGG
jgi:threonine dehydrogenase-like Zn-dependent dehydrogenase